MASYKAIKYLEPNLEVGIENRDEWNGFLATTLGYCEEVSWSSEARSWVLDAGFFAKKSVTKEWGLSNEAKDWRAEALAPPPLLTPANRSSTLPNQSPFKFLRLRSIHLSSFSTNINLTIRNVTSS
jgi:hypothetical protein